MKSNKKRKKKPTWKEQMEKKRKQKRKKNKQKHDNAQENKIKRNELVNENGINTTSIHNFNALVFLVRCVFAFEWISGHQSVFFFLSSFGVNGRIIFIHLCVCQCTLSLH